MILPNRSVGEMKIAGGRDTGSGMIKSSAMKIYTNRDLKSSLIKIPYLAYLYKTYGLKNHTIDYLILSTEHIHGRQSLKLGGMLYE